MSDDPNAQKAATKSDTLAEMEADLVAAEKEAEKEAEEAAEPEEPAEPAESGSPTPGEESSEPREEQASQPAKPPEGYVPHQAMHAERQRAKAAEARLAEMQARLDALENPQEPAPAYVDPLIDPEGHRKWTEHQNREVLAKLEAIERGAQTSQRRAQRMQEAMAYEAEFRKQAGDYDQAIAHLHSQRAAELLAAGIADPQAQIATEVDAIFDAAQTAGLNPAQILYIKAQETGWKASTAAAKTEADRLAAQAKAQAATASLSTAPGEGQGAKLTAAQIAEMSEDEIAKLSEEELAAALGG